MLKALALAIGVGASTAPTFAVAADLPSHRDYGDADPAPQPSEHHQRWDDFTAPADPAPVVIEEWIIHRRRTAPSPAPAERREAGCTDARPVPPPIGPLLSPTDQAALRGGRRHD